MLTYFFNKSLIKYSLIIGLIFGILSIPLYYSFKYYLSFKDQKYCYDDFKNYDRFTIGLLSYEYKDDYLSFYEKKKMDIDTSFGFPSRFIPKNEKVYILDYNEDSTLAKIFVESQLEKGFFYFWVYAETLHDEPPKINNNKTQNDSIH